METAFTDQNGHLHFYRLVTRMNSSCLYILVYAFLAFTHAFVLFLQKKRTMSNVTSIS